MISSLLIVVLSSLDQQGHSITCTNVGIGTKTVTKFQLAGMFSNIFIIIIALVPVRMTL